MSDHRPHGKTLTLDEGAARLWLAYDGQDDLNGLTKIFKKARADLHLVQPGVEKALVPVDGPLPLARYEAACRAVAECVRIDEAKDIVDKAQAIRVYAKQVKNPELEADAWAIRKRAERQLGKLSADLDKAEAHGGKIWLPSSGKSKSDVLADAGISTSSAHRYEQLWKVLSDSEWETLVAKGREQITAGYSHADAVTCSDACRQKQPDDDDAREPRRSQQLGGSGDDEYFTPSKYVEAVRDVLGEIDLDPASCPEAQAIVKATRYFTKDDDGLKQEWHGRVFLNPPWSAPLPWVQKLIEECQSGRVTEAILLTFSNTSTRWFQTAAGASAAICFTNTNIAFIHRAKGQMGRSAIGQAFLYFGRDVENFARRFSPLGFIVKPYKPKNIVLLPVTKQQWEAVLKNTGSWHRVRKAAWHDLRK